MKPHRNAFVCLLAVWALFYGPWTIAANAQSSVPTSTAGDSTLSSAICPIIYPLDQSPSDRGYHYTFYGNGFFINSDGYLLTAAHVLSQLSDVQPYIVLRLPMAPPRILKAAIVAIDHDHDVALLRAIPNPFEGRYQVKYLPLAIDWPAPPQAVLAAALRPSRLRDPHTYDAFVEDRPAGEVLEYEFSQLEKGRPSTELFLFSHEVLLGDSGAPVVAAESQAVVGFVEGRWLRPSAASLATALKEPSGGIGAAVPIHYALPLLQQNGITWHAATAQSGPPGSGGDAEDTSLPMPLSLVAAPYPSQSFGGGEVVLDALVDDKGQVADVKVVRGAEPFLQTALSAVQTWSFRPARANGEILETRIGIIFQFAPPAFSPGSKLAQHYDVALPDAADRAAFPISTTLPDASTASGASNSVILSARINAKGELSSVKVLRETGPVGASVLAAFHQWQFAAGKRDGTPCDSELIAVVMPGHKAAPVHAPYSAQMQPAASQ